MSSAAWVRVSADFAEKRRWEDAGAEASDVFPPRPAEKGAEDLPTFHIFYLRPNSGRYSLNRSK